MKLSVLVWGMAKQGLPQRDGFTLIEVMVSVMIISVVIMALIKMYANNTHIYTTLKLQTDTNQYSSFLISNDDYGFENSEVRLNDLLGEFDLNDDLRRKLKMIKVKLIYQELQQIEDDEETSSVILTIGKTTIKTQNSSTSFLRLTQ